MLAASDKKHNVTVWHPSVCLTCQRILNVTHQGAARNAGGAHFRPSIMRIDY